MPLVVNILHLSLPDKRLVELSAVLDRIIGAFELVQRDCIKLELVKAYLVMLNECSDRAALKITMVSRKFFICLLEQARLICLTSRAKNSNNKTTTNEEDLLLKTSDNNDDNDDLYITFLHEFVRVVLSLLKNLLENSQSVKDIFTDCACYDLLYQILKEYPSEVLDIEISMLINEMASVVSFLC